MLQLTLQFSKLAGYKIIKQKSPAFLYTNNEAEEREMKESITFAIAPKTIGINLTKEVKDLYSRNYRKLIKGMEEKENIPCSWIVRINMVKLPSAF